MANPADQYDRFYAEKLWALLPVVYRTEDAPTLDGRGPLRELVERMGVQAAVLRRSIDRLWADQSIETCDDWVISYLARLLATNLVSSLDARGQRLDVAKTIYYRRRKGTVALLEELATDVTGWSARVVEMFRLLGRTRHLLDPPLGDPAGAPDPDAARGLQTAQRLVGARTGTPAGGMADLRNLLGASRTGTAFDEYCHTVDVRPGRGGTGWYDIPRLGVFVWRLHSHPITQATPVADASCPNQYTFDPTGRDLPLFAAATRALGDAWISPQEHQLPGPIDAVLFDEARDDLYSAQAPDPQAPDPTDPTLMIVKVNSLGIYRARPTGAELVSSERVAAFPAQAGAESQQPAPDHLVDPVRGRLILRGDAAKDTDAIRLSYCYGFSSEIGAGPYDRRVRGQPAMVEPSPVRRVTGGGAALAAALDVLPSTGTISIEDFLTYDRARDLSGVEAVTIRAGNHRRPVVRLANGAPRWAFIGKGPSARLVLDGLFVSAGEIVLDGSFDEVRIVCCTLDPGERTGSGWAASADGRPLVPCRVRVKGHVRRLVVDRSIVGPIIEAKTGDEGLVSSPLDGRIDALAVSDSIIQAAGPEPAIALASAEVDLARCTVLGRARLHRLHASECILHDVVTVDDAQNGCVRFSAWASGSSLPARYESRKIAPRAALFTSLRFGQPGFAQLLSSVEEAIAEGAQDGSEMGAFARDRNPIKTRSLLIKFQEYMPVGLEPVIVPVT